MTDEKLIQIKAALVLSVAEYGNQDAKDMLEIIERLEETVTERDAWRALARRLAEIAK